MVDSIRVSMMPTTLQHVPDGEAAVALITVQNMGSSVDQYAVELDGLPTTWYTLSSTSVALFPQDKEEARLSIRPPKGAAKAGSYPFTITVLSRADPSKTTRMEGTLQVSSVAAFEIEISPRKVIGRSARFNLTMRNGGNVDQEVELDAFDAEGECDFTFNPAMPRVAAGQRLAVPLQVKARRSGFIGERKPYDFQVKALPSQGEVKTLQAQFVHTPRFKSWKPIWMTLAVIAAIALIYSAFFAPISGPWGPVAVAVRTQVCSRLGISYICSALPKPTKTITPGTATAAAASTANAATATAIAGTPGANIVYIGAFKEFHAANPSLIGDPLAPEKTPPGDVHTQLTTNGVLIFDPKSGRSYFVAKGNVIYEFSNGSVQVLNGNP